MKSKAAIDALAALAQETRLSIFRLLIREGPEGLPAGAIAERLDIPAPTMSFDAIEPRRAGALGPQRTLNHLRRQLQGHERAAYIPHRGLLPGAP